MKTIKKYIKLLLISGFALFLYAFSNHRNQARKVTKPQVQFLGESNLFITQEAVSKLLIQNQSTVGNASKEILDLNKLETALNANPTIQSAQVYVTVNGQLKAEVYQKKPIARVQTKPVAYYVDNAGGYMPLSSNHAARVPMVTGFVKKDSLQNIYQVAKKIANDAFLKKHVIEIMQEPNHSISLKLRNANFVVSLGGLKQLDKKINNLKVFYKKALKENKLQQYSKVNLQFDNQVVCTKA